jgi:protochlorophyllide reductase
MPGPYVALADPLFAEVAPRNARCGGKFLALLSLLLGLACVELWSVGGAAQEEEPVFSSLAAALRQPKMKGMQQTLGAAAWQSSRPLPVASIPPRASQERALLPRLGDSTSPPLFREQAVTHAFDAFGLGGNKGKLKTVVITGASSGLGLQTSRALIESGDWYVIMGVRDPKKMEIAAEELGFPKDKYQIDQVELSSFKSVRAFAKKLKSGRQVDTLICNAAVYLPAQDTPKYTEDGFETSAQVNHLSHFLLFNELMPVIQKSKDPRIIIVGSITGNTNTVGGGAVWPWASLGKLNGLAENDNMVDQGVAMMDGGDWNGAKAYKDSKLANMMTVLEAHRRFHDQTGITFSTIYPGCIAETGLFRDKRPWFRKLFPLFMKYVTGGYVSEPEAGDRLAEVASSEKTKKSGVYWGWNGNAKTVAYLKISADPSQRGLTGAGGAGGEINEVEPSGEARDAEKSKRLWELTAKAVGLPYDQASISVLPESPVEIAAKSAPKSLPGIPLPNFVQDFRGQLDKRAKEGTSSQLTEAQARK